MVVRCPRTSVFLRQFGVEDLQFSPGRWMQSLLSPEVVGRQCFSVNCCYSSSFRTALIQMSNVDHYESFKDSNRDMKVKELYNTRRVV